MTEKVIAVYCVKSDRPIKSFVALGIFVINGITWPVILLKAALAPITKGKVLDNNLISIFIFLCNGLPTPLLIVPSICSAIQAKFIDTIEAYELDTKDAFTQFSELRLYNDGVSSGARHVVFAFLFIFSVMTLEFLYMAVGPARGELRPIAVTIVGGTALVFFLRIFAYPNTTLEFGDWHYRERLEQKCLQESDENADKTVDLVQHSLDLAYNLYYESAEIGIWLYVCGTKSVLINRTLVGHFATVFYGAITVIFASALDSHKDGGCVGSLKTQLGLLINMGVINTTTSNVTAIAGSLCKALDADTARY